MKEKIQADLKEALKAHDEIRTGALRMLLAALTNKEKEGVDDLSEGIIQQVISTEVKKRREAAEAFEKAGKQEMAEKERKELTILQAYLPEQLSEAEIRDLVKEVVEKTRAQGPQDMGKIMAELMPKVKGRADGAIVGKLVKEALG